MASRICDSLCGIADEEAATGPGVMVRTTPATVSAGLEPAAALVVEQQDRPRHLEYSVKILGINSLLFSQRELILCLEAGVATGTLNQRCTDCRQARMGHGRSK